MMGWMGPRLDSKRSWVGLAMLGIALVGPVRAARGNEQEDARRHFKAGVALFQSGDFGAALVEFEASNRTRQTASTLQNIALCFTKLHRYLDALETLDKLTAQYGAGLSAEDRKAVDDSIRQLSQLVGTVQLRVSPSNARISVDGKVLPSEALSRPIRVALGEHKIRADAPLYAPEEKVLKLVGGDNVSVDLTLRLEGGQIAIYASDAGAAIAIDSRSLAYGAWTGPLAPGSHLVQVYKKGYIPYSTWFDIAAGDRLEMRPVLRPSSSAETPGAALTPLTPGAVRTGSQVAETQRAPRGWYGLLSATTLVPMRHPDHFSMSGSSAGGAFGLRLGYRFWENIAFEAMIEGGTQTVGPGTWTNDAGVQSKEMYDLQSGRFGGNVRLLTGGRVARFSAVLGVGGVKHDLTVASTKRSGSDSYLLGEAGVQFNIGHVLLEFMAVSLIEGASNVKSAEGQAPNHPMYTEHTVIPQVGAGFRAGYGEWGRW